MSSTPINKVSNNNNNNNHDHATPIQFPHDRCPNCGRVADLIINNNPLLASCGPHLCLSCAAKAIDTTNLQQVDFFCRTYNYPFNPDLWISLSETESGANLIRQYLQVILNDPDYQPNLHYQTQTHDLWSKVDKEWSRMRSFNDILLKLEPLRESYVARGALKWGEQYEFQDLLRLDSIYVRTLRANNIINPLQKEAVKTLCKIQLQLDAAIREGDSKGIKDYTTAWNAIAKQADIENLIAQTRTGDITTTSDLSAYLDQTGFQPHYYDGVCRDEVDRTLKDIKETIRRTINESTSIQSVLEEMARKRERDNESQATQEASDALSLQELMNFSPDEMNELATESDDAVNNLSFSEEDTSGDLDAPITVSHKESKELTTPTTPPAQTVNKNKDNLN